MISTAWLMALARPLTRKSKEITPTEEPTFRTILQAAGVGYLGVRHEWTLEAVSSRPWC